MMGLMSGHMALLLFVLKRDRCIQSFVELPGLRAFVRAICPFSPLFGRHFARSIVGLFVRSCVILFVRSFTAFFRSLCDLSFGHLACAFIHCLQPRASLHVTVYLLTRK